MAPPESLPTIVTSSSSSASRKLAIDRGDAGRGEVGVGVHRDLVGGDRPVGGDAAEAVREAVDDAVPEPPVDQVAVDEDDWLALARFAVADPARREGRSLCADWSWLMADPPRGELIDCLLAGNYRYRQYECQYETRCRGRRDAEPRRTQAERSEATRDALIAAARRLFAERGYDGVGTEEIVRAAGVTRGALYHHFGGKRELFEAVYEQIEAELAERIAAGRPRRQRRARRWRR